MDACIVHVDESENHFSEFEADALVHTIRRSYGELELPLVYVIRNSAGDDLFVGYLDDEPEFPIERAS